jgi:hypothetical protein
MHISPRTIYGKRVGYCGLVKNFKNDLKFKNLVKMLLCLAFCDENDVIKVFEDIKQWSDSNNIFGREKILEYFGKIYMNLNESPALINSHEYYPIKFWNVHKRILNFTPRTSNGAESWNRTINLRTAIHHPNISHLIVELLKQEELDIFNLKRACKGVYQTIKRDVVFEEKVRITVEAYSLYKDKLKFIESIMNIYKFKFE